MRLLTRRGLALQEDERRELARELHDELGQYLNAIKIDAVTIRDTESGVEATTRQTAVSIIALTDHAYASVRNIMGRLRPVALDELGLSVALEHLTAGWQHRLPNLEIGLQVGEFGAELDEATSMTIYRVTQEALNNIVRHACAKHVRIGLRQVAGGLELVIADDGQGFDTSRRNRGLGLIGMRERTEALGGRLSITSASGAGCILNVRLPRTAGTEA